MARPYRLQSEDCFYHITSRGNDRKKIFLNDTDFEKFLEYILTAKGKYDFYLLAYVLMSNHYHLLIKTTQSNLSRIMHYINCSYTIQDEGTGGEQSGYKDREVDGGEQGDKESGKEANFYFPGLTPSSCPFLLLLHTRESR